MLYPSLVFVQHEGRRRMFDSFAEHTLRTVGVHWWDQSAYSGIGDYCGHDILHICAMSLRWQNLDMFDNLLC